MGLFKRKAVLVSWVFVAVWAVVIFIGSATTGHDFDLGNGPFAVLKQVVSDMLSHVVGSPVDPSPIGHFGEYFVFGALLANALRFHMDTRRALASAVALAACYSITDEVHQIFVPGRTFDLADWVVDVVAASLAAAIFLAVKRSGGSRGRLS